MSADAADHCGTFPRGQDVGRVAGPKVCRAKAQLPLGILLVHLRVERMGRMISIKCVVFSKLLSEGVIQKALPALQFVSES